jgi:hypothetical protein
MAKPLVSSTVSRWHSAALKRPELLTAWPCATVTEYLKLLQLPCHGQTLEQLHRQELIPQAAVEAFSVAIFPRAAWR